MITRQKDYITFRETFINTALVTQKGWEVNGSPTISKGVTTDGSNDYLDLPIEYIGNRKNTVGTISCEIEIGSDSGNFEIPVSIGRSADATVTNFYIGLDFATNDALYVVLLTDDTAQWAWASENNLLDSLVNTTVKITVVQNATKPRIFINGVENTVGTFVESLDRTKWIKDLYTASSPADTFRIGGNNGSSFNAGFAGTVKDFKITEMQWTDETVLDDAQKDIYLETKIENAVLYLPLHKRYKSGSTQVTDNLGSVGGLVTVGDGTTSSTFPTRLLPKGFSFDGGDYLSLADDDNYDFNTGEVFSIAFGIRDVIGASAVTILQKIKDNGAGMGSTGNFGYDVMYRGDLSKVIQFRCRDTGNRTATLTGTTQMRSGRFYHCVITTNRTTAELYVNGVQEASVSVATITDMTNNGLVKVGTGVSYINAKLYDIGIWRKILTPLQIRDLYNKFISNF